MRGLVVALAACTAGGYLDDRDVRREELVASLVNPTNGYARVRLRHYGEDWEALPEHNPTGLDLDAPDLGERAFFGYPVGLITSDAPFTVPVPLADGTTGRAYTCATCHTAERDGALVVGLGNDRLDLGWGPGRVDVSSSDGSEPVRIPDIRPTRWLTHLHVDANVVQRDLTTLAIRIETLIITSNGATLRPPRAVALALATYVWSLADTLPAPAPRPAVFAAACAGCHDGPGLTGAPVPIAVVGTDPTVGRSPERGTGTYRVPSLRGVGQRALLLHDGSVGSLDALFDPLREGGHFYGRTLDDGQRAELLAYLRRL